MNTVAPRISQIKLLPDHLINQIAAGEVIERPASVVKELLDNSLDAGASQVTVDIEHGGVGLIRVQDDGSGIHHDDLLLSLTRHATSKIRRLDDLRQLSTMGFRGEALPSIASISRLTIKSGIKEDDHAWMVKSEGRVERYLPEPVSHPQGTTIEVRDLFYNVPARRKYLRAERTEFYQIQQLVRHFAISHPELAVKLTHNGRQILNLKAAIDDHGAARVLGVNGSRFMQHSVRVDTQNQQLRLTGWVGKAEAARTMNDAQFFCLNGRCIRDKRVNHAILQAYQNILPEGRHATYALYLEIDPTMVDINVHPAKTEVRFREGRTVHDFIYSVLSQALEQTSAPITSVPLVSVPSTGSSSQRAASPVFRPKSIQETANVYRSEHDHFKLKHIKEPVTSLDDIDQIGGVLLIKKTNELLLIDVRKATVELCRSQLQAELKTGTVLAKPLLFPYLLELDKIDFELINTHQEMLGKVGIILENNDQKEWHLRQMPTVFSIPHMGNFIVALLQLLRQNKPDMQSRLINMMADQQASNPLPEPEILLAKMDLFEQKNIVRTLSADDLLKIIHE